MKNNKKLQILSILILATISAITACSTTNGSSVGVTTGQGEFKNKTRTNRTEVVLRKDLGGYHVSAKHETLTSKAIDDPVLSLVDGDRTSIGVGVHTNRGTDLTAYFSDDDLWNVELTHRTDPIRWDLYAILGITHLDSFKREQGVKRKTTAAVVGLGYILTNNTNCEATMTTRNNGAEFIDDYVQIGCRYDF